MILRLFFSGIAVGFSFRGRLRSTVSVCDCGCCLVSNRPPSQEINGVNAMCAKDSSEARCPAEQCQADSTTGVITSSGAAVDYGRFCFLTCRPPDAAHFGDLCVDLTNDQLEAVRTSGGNGMDLAALNPDPAASGLDAATSSEVTGRSAGGDAADGDAQNASGDEEESEEEKGRRTLAAASEARSARSAMEAQRALTEAEKAESTTYDTARTNLSEVATLRSIKAQTQMHRRAAHEARKRTQAALRDIENAPRDAAVAVAQEAKAIMEQAAVAAEAKAKTLELKFNPPPTYTAEAAQRAAAPYNQAMSRAMGMQNIYSAKAQELSGTAEQLQNNAKQLAADASAYRSVGDPNAAAMAAKADNMIREATGLNGEAQTNQQVAEQINQSIPAYQISASAASARAASLANPMAHPPLPIF